MHSLLVIINYAINCLFHLTFTLQKVKSLITEKLRKIKITKEMEGPISLLEKRELYDG
jgi:hypothetical protein